jgi:hypothetical protein
MTPQLAIHFSLRRRKVRLYSVMTIAQRRDVGYNVLGIHELSCDVSLFLMVVRDASISLNNLNER